MRGSSPRMTQSLWRLLRSSPGSSLNRLFFGGLGLLGGLCQIGLGDPPGDDARLHDYGFGVFARGFIGVENARVLGRLAAFLALGPADEVVGGAAGEIL